MKQLIFGLAATAAVIGVYAFNAADATGIKGLVVPATGVTEVWAIQGATL